MYDRCRLGLCQWNTRLFRPSDHAPRYEVTVLPISNTISVLDSHHLLGKTLFCCTLYLTCNVLWLNMQTAKQSLRSAIEKGQQSVKHCTHWFRSRMLMQSHQLALQVSNCFMFTLYTTHLVVQICYYCYTAHSLHPHITHTHVAHCNTYICALLANLYPVMFFSCRARHGLPNDHCLTF